MKNGPVFASTLIQNGPFWNSLNYPGISGISGQSRQSSGNGGKTAVRTHPTSRAGGQDYGSFNKLPQITGYYIMVLTDAPHDQLMN